MLCYWYGQESLRPRNFTGMYLSSLGKFLLTPKLGKDNLYRADVIWSPSNFEKLVSSRV